MMNKKCEIIGQEKVSPLSAASSCRLFELFDSSRLSQLQQPAWLLHFTFLSKYENMKFETPEVWGLPWPRLQVRTTNSWSIRSSVMLALLDPHTPPQK